jgi:hypothetical protein
MPIVAVIAAIIITIFVDRTIWHTEATARPLPDWAAANQVSG